MMTGIEYRGRHCGEPEREQTKAEHLLSQGLLHWRRGCPVCDPLGYARKAKHRGEPAFLEIREHGS